MPFDATKHPRSTRPALLFFRSLLVWAERRRNPPPPSSPPPPSPPRLPRSGSVRTTTGDRSLSRNSSSLLSSSSDPTTSPPSTFTALTHQIEPKIAVDHVHQRETDRLYRHRAVQAALVVPQPPTRGQNEVPEGEDVPPEPAGGVAEVRVVVGGYEGAADHIPTLLEVPPNVEGGGGRGGDHGGGGPAARPSSSSIIPDAALSPPPRQRGRPRESAAAAVGRISIVRQPPDAVPVAFPVLAAPDDESLWGVYDAVSTEENLGRVDSTCSDQ